MHTVQQIFSNKLLRIPDYQRGYAWEKNHIEDFWQDISNLQSDRSHYTGMISVESISNNNATLEEDLWLIGNGKKTAFYIVDGQQRLTTIVILLWCIINSIKEDEELDFESKSSLIKEYIYTSNVRNDLRSFIFNYDKENLSYAYLINEIFELKENNNYKIEETYYTKNLKYCKTYFLNKIKNLSLDEKSKLFNKVTTKLVFDFKVLNQDLDIFIVFETMNNRGKPLSNLEKLKNRLIYLSTLLSDDINEKNALRKEINYVWKEIYKYLGLSNTNRLKDDQFLMNHWIMYDRYDRASSEFYVNDIFERHFTTRRIFSTDVDRLTIEEVYKYITSLKESIKVWFIMFNPYHKESKQLVNNEYSILLQIAKLEILGYKAFLPLVMTILLKIENENKNEIEYTLRLIGNYIFLLFNVSFRRSNTGTYYFYSKANDLFTKSISIDQIITDLKYWINGDDYYNGYFDILGLVNNLRDNNSMMGAESLGYESWKSLKYFLLEFIVSEFDDREKLYLFSHYSSLRVFKISDLLIDADEKESINNEYLKSLGNYILLDFSDNKPEVNELLGSFYTSNVDVEFNIEDTSIFESNILNHGVKLLNFLEINWEVSLGSLQKKREILFLPEIKNT